MTQRLPPWPEDTTICEQTFDFPVYYTFPLSTNLMSQQCEALTHKSGNARCTFQAGRQVFPDGTTKILCGRHFPIAMKEYNAKMEATAQPPAPIVAPTQPPAPIIQLTQDMFMAMMAAVRASQSPVVSVPEMPPDSVPAAVPAPSPAAVPAPSTAPVPAPSPAPVLAPSSYRHEDAAAWSTVVKRGTKVDNTNNINVIDDDDGKDITETTEDNTWDESKPRHAIQQHTMSKMLDKKTILRHVCPKENRLTLYLLMSCWARDPDSFVQTSNVHSSACEPRPHFSVRFSLYEYETHYMTLHFVVNPNKFKEVIEVTIKKADCDHMSLGKPPKLQPRTL